MLFQTPEFLILMLAVTCAVVLVRTHMLQMVMLLLASYIFYMSWNPAFILLIIYSTLNDYIAGLGIGRSRTHRARVAWLIMSLVTNLGILAVFKYCGFFTESVNQLLQWLGVDAALPVIALTLPVGISFFTFQSMSYTIDVFRGQIQPERSFVRFALYVAFFPQLVAGPILRSTEFLPQLHSLTTLQRENLRSGCHLFLTGLVKKVLIADQVAPLANGVFEASQGLPSPAIWLGTLAFGIQIYCDFSGYTDMARGTGRMLGFNIPINFNFPYAARSITDFWRRWHISLSTWLRDYLYIPLGGNRHGTASTYRNLLLTMGLGGLWHGAGWNFVFWGLYQGGWLALERAMGLGKGRSKGVTGASSPEKGKEPSRASQRLHSLIRWLICQYLVFLGWLLFRVHGSSDLVYCVKKYVLFDFDFNIASLGLGNVNPFLAVGIMGVFVIFHFWSYRAGTLAARLDALRGAKRIAVYFMVFFALFVLWPTSRSDFIYFQF
ncbi:MAG: MBOAT family protein [Phycisphaerae bacterium]|nr:MBOAT family protein [Phycisphaerae bacterium]